MKAKKAIKTPAKKPAKKVASKPAKKSPKSVVKKSAKAAIKKPAKAATKKAVKKLAKDPAKKPVKKIVKKAVAAKPAVKLVPKKAVKKTVKKVAAKRPAAKKPAAKKPAPEKIVVAPTKLYDGPPWPLMEAILEALEDAKAESILPINVEGRSSVADGMVIATGRVNRHVAAIADQLVEKLKAIGQRDIRVEGLEQGDWVLVDAGNVIVHIFRPEVRAFYNLEKLWSEHAPAEKRED